MRTSSVRDRGPGGERVASYCVVDVVVVAPVSGCCSVWLVRDSRRVGLPCASDDFVHVVSRVPPDFVDSFDVTVDV
ncbi:hypothetical protein [Corallococcus sp. AB011P]|uniref:hypothetical protein n=1 Tax=Corallococcus sp. AB011P TaxID=2316735 RepID=UPI0011C4A79F|nr:hypothetical protein [Corallococcus sp. AB011P]